jgi:hypothetical protein
MIVECRFNKISEINSPEYLNHVLNYIHLSEVSLQVGNKYVVYGLIFREGIPWYYICENEADEYPHPHFAGFFKVIDSKLSAYWKLSWSPAIPTLSSLLPEEWAENKLFYENLVEGNEHEEGRFQYFKSLIDKESGVK